MEKKVESIKITNNLRDGLCEVSSCYGDGEIVF